MKRYDGLFERRGNSYVKYEAGFREPLTRTEFGNVDEDINMDEIEEYMEVEYSGNRYTIYSDGEGMAYLIIGKDNYNKLDKILRSYLEDMALEWE